MDSLLECGALWHPILDQELLYLQWDLEGLADKITVTNQKGKYDTNLRGRRGEGKSKPKMWSSPYLTLRIYHPPHLYVSLCAFLLAMV